MTKPQPSKSKGSDTLVLIVDDDVPTTLILDSLLRKAGFRTMCAYELGTAERLIRSEPVSLVLLDVHLPDGSGLDLCEKLTADSALSGIPVVFISSSDDVEIKVRGFGVGAVDYITKPLAGAEVLARVRTHLRLRAAYKLLAELQEERIHRLASTQKSFMPQPDDLPEAGFQVCMKQALQAGGDFYDVLLSGNRITDYIVADASGHDLGTALWTVSFKTLLSEYSSILYEPPDICRRINDSLMRLLPEGSYFTAIHARLNRAAGRLTLVSAGHPPAILFSAKTGMAKTIPQEGDLLGIFPDPVFGRIEIPVQAGDRIFLYSDGLIELDGPRDQGTALLEEACRATSNLTLKMAVLSIVNSLCAQAVPEDDIVLLGIEV